MKQRLLFAVAVCFLAAWQAACGGSPGSNGGGTPPPPPVTITISGNPLTVNAAGQVQLTATASGGNGNLAVTWSASPNVGSFSPASGTSVVYTAPADSAMTQSPEQITITGTASSGKQSSSNTVDVTVDRTITLSLAPGSIVPNSEIYSDFGAMVPVWYSCVGCEVGDTVYVQGSFGNVGQETIPSGFLDPWNVLYNWFGELDIPGPTSLWVTGQDGVKSNTVWLAFDGSQNMAAEDSSTGEIFYAYPGNGTSFSQFTMNFHQDGTTDGEFSDAICPCGVAVDSSTHEVLEPSESGILQAFTSTGNSLGGIGINRSNVLGVSTADGIGCGTEPESDIAFCTKLPSSPFNGTPAFALPGIPSGSQPTPILILDASDVVLYGRGDTTLRWYTVSSSGTSATAAGTLTLSQFTPANAAYWNQYPVTGGWEITEVNGILGVMGQVVNADGTVSQKLALVNNADQTLAQYVSLPPGTIHITADPVHNGILAEYVDVSGATPITRFVRIDVNTGSMTTLSATSALFPGVGFLVTNDGSHIAVFVGGKADFEPYQ